MTNIKEVTPPQETVFPQMEEQRDIGEGRPNLTAIIDENRLFQDLNIFVSLIDNLQGNEDADTAYICDFLRSNLLSHLRTQQKSFKYVFPTKSRDLLIQWWIALLNHLNDELSIYLLDIRFVGVMLECISRIMAILMILPIHPFREIEIYSHHILMTARYVTNRLVSNTKQVRKLTNENKTQHDDNDNDYNDNGSELIEFLNKYNSLLRGFLGKLNAYAFFYLSDEFHFDTQLLLSISSHTIYENGHSLFPWKERSFKLVKRDSNEDYKEKLIDIKQLGGKRNKDVTFFQIIISYMKNDNIFMAFYWHFWYIVLKYLSHTKNNMTNLKQNLRLIPGALMLLNYTSSTFLKVDIGRFVKYIKNQKFKGSDAPSSLSSTENMNDSMPSPIIDGLNTDRLNDFIFTNFKSIKIWECLSSLAHYISVDTNVSSLLRIQDSFGLKYIQKIPAHDYNVANIVYNKLFQFIIFQFCSQNLNNFLNWDSWLRGIIGMLQTLHMNSQLVATICLFNIWSYLPKQIQNQYSIELIIMNKELVFEKILIESSFPILKIFFCKLLVYKILSTSNDYQTKNIVRIKLKGYFQELKQIQTVFEQYDYVPSTIADANESKQNDLIFFGNKKLVVRRNKPLNNEFILSGRNYQGPNKIMKKKLIPKALNFPNMVQLSNLNPSLILLKGKYPYDVFDGNSQVIASNPIVPNTSSNSNSNSNSTSPSSSLTSQEEPQNLRNTLNSWFAKFTGTNTTGSQSNIQLGLTMAPPEYEYYYNSSVQICNVFRLSLIHI